MDALTKVVDRSLGTMLRAILKRNHKSCDEYLPHIEFVYNRVVHKNSKVFPFEVVYGFNLFTPLDHVPLPNPIDFIQKENASRFEFVKKMHTRVISVYLCPHLAFNLRFLIGFVI